MPLLDPVSAAWNNAARFDDYESAQRAVDRLSDDGFPVEKVEELYGSRERYLEPYAHATRSAVAASVLPRDTDAQIEEVRANCPL